MTNGKSRRGEITSDNSQRNNESKKSFNVIIVTCRYSLITTADDNTHNKPEHPLKEKSPSIIIHKDINKSLRI